MQALRCNVWLISIVKIQSREPERKKVFIASQDIGRNLIIFVKNFRVINFEDRILAIQTPPLSQRR